MQYYLKLSLEKHKNHNSFLVSNREDMNEPFPGQNTLPGFFGYSKIKVRPYFTSSSVFTDLSPEDVIVFNNLVGNQ